MRDPIFSARAIEAYHLGPQATEVQVRAAAGDDPVELLIYSRIGDSFFEDGVTASGVTAALARANGAPVRVRINSPGGDAFEGLAIYNILRGYAGGVETVVDGLAASAASVIALAGSTLTMQDASLFMIHNARTIAGGTRADFSGLIELLSRMDQTMQGIYAGKTGKATGEMGALMDAETWFTSAEAKAAGLADTVLPGAGSTKPAPKAEAVPVVAEVDEAAIAENRDRVRKLRLLRAR